MTSPANTLTGNYIGVNQSGNRSGPGNGGNGITVGPGSSTNTVVGNLIGANTGAGISLTGTNVATTANTIRGNLIGASVAGGALGNGSGITIAGADHTTIGGTTAAQANTISDNAGAGIHISGATAQANTITGNAIGLAGGGSANGGNGGDGIAIDTGAGTTAIGTAGSGAGNYVADNLGHGIHITGPSTQNTVLGNVIGLDSANNYASNSLDGVRIEAGATQNAIGSSSSGAGNTISGNLQRGILIIGAGTTLNTVTADLIGTTSTGYSGHGNGGTGVTIAGGATANTISASVISSNGGNGVSLLDGATANNVITGNLIGTDISGQSPKGNSANGVLIDLGASNNKVGDVNGLGNTIAYNRTGVVIPDANSTGNAIRANAIYTNQPGLGIDLGPSGVTPNTPGGPHAGANHLQNFPVLTTIGRADTGTTITGTLNSAPNDDFDLDLFSGPACDASAYGQGQVYVGSVAVHTDANGNASFTTTVPSRTGTQVMTATATERANKDTSEFSVCRPVPPPPGPPTTTNTTGGTPITPPGPPGPVVVPSPHEKPPAARRRPAALSLVHVRRHQRGTLVRGSMVLGISGSQWTIDLLADSRQVGVARVTTVGHQLRRGVKAGRHNFTVLLNARGRRALRRLGRLSVRVRIAVRAPGGGRGAASRVVDLRR